MKKIRLVESFEEYKGYYIEDNFYGNGEYSVQYNGDDILFDTEEEAKKFIDEILLNESMLTEGATSNGVYSLYNGWVKMPTKETIPDVVELEPELSELVSESEQCTDINSINDFIDKLYKLRQSGILKDGEYSKGNLLFKEIRNKGILTDLKAKKVELENKEMSI